MFRAFRSRNYRLLWFGQLVSVSGAWMQRVAQAWLVLQLTDSPIALGTVAVIQFSPLLVLSLFGGVIADRLPKRRVLALTQAVMATQALAIAVLTSSGRIELWHVYVLALVHGLANALDNPARQAFVMEIVGPEDISNAVALNSSLFNSARITGPSIGGAIIASAGLAACFWLNALSYLAVLLALAAMRPAEFFGVATPRRGRLLGQVREGLSYALGTRDVRLMLILLAAFGSFGFNFQTFIPLLARYVLGTGALGFGVLFSIVGAGSVLAGLSLAARRESSERTLLVASAAFAGILLLVGLSSNVVVTAVLLFCLGAASIVVTATANTRLQLAAPAELRGRVMSLYTLLVAGTTPIGGYLTGTLSEHFGVATALTINASACFMGLFAALVYARRKPASGLVAEPDPGI